MITQIVFGDWKAERVKDRWDLYNMKNNKNDWCKKGSKLFTLLEYTAGLCNSLSSIETSFSKEAIIDYVRNNLEPEEVFNDIYYRNKLAGLGVG